jgi:L-threonylcarbamoyladenylate synthase
MAEIGTDINKAINLLKAGQLVAIPTETVYGLAGNALNLDAVTAIFTVKNRPRFDPLIVHVQDLDQVADYTLDIPYKARRLAESYWPGPLTLLLPKNDRIHDLVTAGMPSVGMRCPAHPLTHRLLDALPFPLAAPSANPFGYISPTHPDHVNQQLGDRISYILDGGACPVGIESTIVGFSDHETVVHRLGGLSLEDIESIIGSVTVKPYSASDPAFPGQFRSHYAPEKKVVLGDLRTLLASYPADRAAVLSFSTDLNLPYQFVLTSSGNMEEAARNLFVALHEFEKFPVDVILAEPVPDHGLGRAINDRLRRAAALY